MITQKSSWLSAICYWLLMAAAASSASAGHLYVNLADLGLSSATNRTVLITGSSLPKSQSSMIIVQDKLRRVTDTNGTFWVSNAVPGVYFMEVQSPPARTEFRVLMPDTNGVVIAAENLVAAAANTFPQGTVAWSTDASDRRYAFKGGGGSGTNVFLGSTVHAEDGLVYQILGRLVDGQITTSLSPLWAIPPSSTTTRIIGEDGSSYDLVGRTVDGQTVLAVIPTP